MDPYQGAMKYFARTITHTMTVVQWTGAGLAVVSAAAAYLDAMVVAYMTTGAVFGLAIAVIAMRVTLHIGAPSDTE